jgi:homoserine O-succinyltransferase
MSLVVDGGRIPPRWAERLGSPTQNRNEHHTAGREPIRIGLINNMPDSALEDTEMQFMELLDRASGSIPVRVSLYSLAQVPRGERAQQHLDRFYCGVDQLWNSGVDSVIITGTEPRQADLCQEPYWTALTEVFDWAAGNTISTVLSCLAAHAGVLHSDGIRRQPLGGKLFGVFESNSVDHLLTRNAPQPLRFPHSRWNEVREDSLAACGYSILTKSAEAGADLFVKRKRKSLFVHFQGHPEYSTQTLLKEYRRDVRRFLRRERETYPAMPRGYFEAPATTIFNEFQARALADPREEQMASFPATPSADSAENTWSSTARTVYSNWLQYIKSRLGERRAFAALVQNRAIVVSSGKELT